MGAKKAAEFIERVRRNLPMSPSLLNDQKKFKSDVMN